MSLRKKKTPTQVQDILLKCFAGACSSAFAGILMLITQCFKIFLTLNNWSRLTILQSSMVRANNFSNLEQHCEFVLFRFESQNAQQNGTGTQFVCFFLSRNFRTLTTETSESQNESMWRSKGSFVESILQQSYPLTYLPSLVFWSFTKWSFLRFSKSNRKVHIK